MLKAVIQAGGRGTRLAPITKNEIPKPMVDILGKPLLKWQIEKLRNNGIVDFIIIVGHLGRVITDYFGDGSNFGVRIQYIVEKELLGTAGVFYYLKEYLRPNENFIFVYADALFDINIEKMKKFHLEKHSVGTLFVHPNSHPYDSDLVLLDSNNRICGFDTKDNNRDYWYKNIVNAGFFIFNSVVCETVKEPRKIALEKDLIAALLKKNIPFYGYLSSEYIKDAGTVERLKTVTEELKNGFVEKRNLKNKQKCIFIDRDGTINRFNGLVDAEEKFELEKFTVQAIQAINKAGYLAIVITNQPVVARGLCSVAELEKIHNKMQTLLGQNGAYLDDVLYCPHHPDKGYPDENPRYKIDCECRKPKIGMIQKMEAKYNIDLLSSWFIGDTTVDLKTAQNAGLNKCLVKTGEAGSDQKYIVKPDLIADNLLDAVYKILGSEDNV